MMRENTEMRHEEWADERMSPHMSGVSSSQRRSEARALRPRTALKPSENPAHLTGQRGNIAFSTRSYPSFPTFLSPHLTWFATRIPHSLFPTPPPSEMPSLIIVFHTILLLLLLLSSCAFLPLHAQSSLPAPLFFSCSKTAANYTANSTFQHNLNQLLLSLTAFAIPTGFNATSFGRAPDQVYGLVLCRGDVVGSACQNCVRDAGANALKGCPYVKAGVVMMELCFLRYSDTNFIGQRSTHWYMRCNPYDISDPALFFQKLRVMMQNLTSIATTNPANLMFATGSIAYNDFRIIHGMAQCKRDLSVADCRICLTGAMTNLTGFCKAKQGAQFRGWSCDLRYELYSFVSALPQPPTEGPALSPVPSSPPANGFVPSSVGTHKKRITLMWVLPFSILAGLVILAAVACLLMKRVGNRERKEVTEEIKTRASLFFDINTVKAATDNFSDLNKIGEGGFGPVYKGKLPEGQMIAVKRLSKDSGQGAMQFKNEVVLVAKLQHRNLVRLLGCSWEGEEKILIYEYAANGSLDKFLFDPTKSEQLQWGARFRIIGGIARGLLYLHEESRLKIIHRDLKASNVLLDKEMNPKISDFGLAKLCGLDEAHGNTRKIAGTYGYMSPEYALRGLFSVKSDIFSFGVLLLEIVSGHKNTAFFQTELDQDLLSYAWKAWSENRPVDLIDSNLGELYPRNEVLRCIHIGLLCVQEDPNNRPTTSEVVLMLNNSTVSLRAPLCPAFFSGRSRLNTEEPIEQQGGMLLNDAISDDISKNEITITELYPREMPSLIIVFHTILLLLLLLSSCAFLPLHAQSSLPAPLFFSCSKTAANYTANSTFQHNLNQLLLSLTASAIPTGFNATSFGRAPDQVYGLVLCRGDVVDSACQNCVRDAGANALKGCPYVKAGVVMMELCFLRYSDTNFIGQRSTHWYMRCNPYDISDPALFFQKLRVMMQNLSSIAATNPANLMFATGSIAYNDFRIIYGMAQCKRDLSVADCRTCLTGGMNNLTGFCKAKQGAQFRGWSCDLRYELYPFVSALPQPPTEGPALSPVPSSPPANGFVPSSVGTVTEEIKTRASLFFDINTVKAATDNFSDLNKIGEGGFGPVYKGKLPAGQMIAVKRLSKDSGQGARQFKNEVALVAKLQHRNLVRLLGWSWEGEEKILIYEYAANGSLDKFLFDPTKSEQLQWGVRFRIIGGIARGLLYLHEESQLKIIHRDLKASNILLDKEMNPKISDFGLAKLCGLDETHGNTRKIAGTYGYMSPEYALRGLFSVKSDIFSFGVLLLEIVSGHKNTAFFQTDLDQDLLSYAWKAWSENRAVDLIDSNLGELYPRNEVLRCIHIGLLCVQEDPDNRPTTSEVVLMLNNSTVSLRAPLCPAFFSGRSRLNTEQPIEQQGGMPLNDFISGDISKN
ncbi:putative cysteine-rich receptor-like protein kinase 20 [Nymphaea thermarum]|nr:putative cysteine-rich receptor-like protein kinase 20 [Nymphaea thermarum]